MPSGEKLRNSIPAAKVGGGGPKPAPPRPAPAPLTPCPAHCPTPSLSPPCPLALQAAPKVRSLPPKSQGSDSCPRRTKRAKAEHATYPGQWGRQASGDGRWRSA